jgi:hypothetical protein
MITMLFCWYSGIQWFKVELPVTGSRSRTDCNAHDRERYERRDVGCSTELSLGHIMDANIGESLWGRLMKSLFGSIHIIVIVNPICHPLRSSGVQPRYHSSRFPSVVDQLSES